MTKEVNPNNSFDANLPEDASTMPIPGVNPATAATPAEAVPDETPAIAQADSAQVNPSSGSSQPAATPEMTEAPTEAPHAAAQATEPADSAARDAKNTQNAKDAKTTKNTKAAKKSAAKSKAAKVKAAKSAKVQPEFVATPKQKSALGLKAVIFILLGVSLLTSALSLTYCVWDFLRDDPAVTFTYGNDGNSANFTEGSIAEIAAKVTPGVVSIVTEVQTTSFFGQSATSTAAGTGMIVTKDGYVLTNKHVIDGASSIKIVLDDGTTYDQIELAGTDPFNDVAFLKIKDGKDLPTVKLGNSKTITAGQQVIAIGNALGQFQNTITSGIISGTGRAIEATSGDYSSSESLTDMIQTDAAINAGNSGGPLVNAAGEVIGINTATSANADGIGFAIPISSVKGMLKNITEHNSAKRAYLGVYYLAITPDVATAYNLPVSSGAYIYSPSQYSAIISDSPAAKAGLKDKDIVTKINGVEVGSAGSVSTLIGEYAPGDTIQLTILRDNKEHIVNITLGSYSK